MKYDAELWHIQYAYSPVKWVLERGIAQDPATPPCANEVPRAYATDTELHHDRKFENMSKNMTELSAFYHATSGSSRLA